jgi:hypothetical protein
MPVAEGILYLRFPPGEVNNTPPSDEYGSPIAFFSSITIIK